MQHILVRELQDLLNQLTSIQRQLSEITTTVDSLVNDEWLNDSDSEIDLPVFYANIDYAAEHIAQVNDNLGETIRHLEIIVKEG